MSRLRPLTARVSPDRCPCANLTRSPRNRSEYVQLTDRLALIGLYIFSFFALLGVAPANLGLVILLIATVAACPRFLAWLRREPRTWPILAFSVYVLGRSLAGMSIEDSLSHPDWRVTRDWALLGTVPVLAFWVQACGREELVMRLLWTALAGFLLGRLLELDAATIENIMSIQRDKFGLRVLSASAYAAIAGLGLLVYRRRWVNWLQVRWGLPARLGAYAGIAAIGIFLLVIVVTTLARGTWLAAAIAFPVVALGMSWPYLRQPFGCALRHFGLGAGITVLVLGALMMVAGDHIVDRITSESKTWGAIASGDWESIPYSSSVGIRFHMLQQGFQWIGEAPAFGKGAGSLEPLLSNTDDLQQHTDLHNTFMDAAVELGLIGLGLMLSFILAAYVALVTAFQDGRIKRDTFWFFTGAAMIYFGVAMTNDRILAYDGKFTWLLLMAGMLGLATWCCGQRQPRTDHARSSGTSCPERWG